MAQEKFTGGNGNRPNLVYSPGPDLCPWTLPGADLGPDLGPGPELDNKTYIIQF